jgi:gliding motility-associated-like protein
MRINLRHIFFLFFSFPLLLSAQLWNGNLGLPIVNIDFGSGQGQALPSNETSFSYSSGCPAPGTYSIEHFLFGCATGTWIQLTGDHTRNHDGNYMLVNAANSPGTVIEKTITDLCGNTTYQLSAFISSALNALACEGNPVLPNLTLSMETASGTVLASSITGDIPVTDSKQWVEYGVYYTMPEIPVPLVIKITSTTSGSCGSVFILDDITLKAAGPDIAVKVNGADIAEVDVCKGYTTPLVFEGTYSAGFTDPAVQWQNSVDSGRTWNNIPGAATASYNMPHRDDSLILYHFGVSERSNAGNINCIIYSNSIWTNVHRLPNHIPLQQILGCLDKPLQLVPSPDFSTYQWSGPNGFQSDNALVSIPNLQNSDAGLYIVLLTANFGCSVKDSFQVNTFPGTTVSTKTEYNICEGVSVRLSASGDGTYLWSPDTGLSDASIPNPVVTPADSIQYKVVLTNTYGCRDSAYITINVFKNAAADAGPDKTILLGDTVLLNGSVKGTDVNYYWSPSGSISNVVALKPAVFPSMETTYTLNAISTKGCGNTKSDVTIKVYKDIFMPNAFSPNGDGINDIYYPLTINSYQLVSFIIFNRSGGKIFQTTNAAAGWDGSINGNPQDAGAYVYYLEMKNAAGKRINRKGNIILIR